MIGDRPPTEEMVSEFEQEQHASQNDAADGSMAKVNVWPDYGQWITEVTEDPNSHGLRILVDPGNGSWAEHGVGLWRKCFSSARVDAIHDRRDGTFRDRSPDSANPRNLNVLKNRVIEERYDVGLAFDGDGDRVSFVDEKGGVLTAEEATAILLSSFDNEISGQPFVYDIKFSEIVHRAALGLGARPLEERSGHSFIRTRMLEENALFGAEISGHYFYRELDGGDDAFYTGLILLRHLQRTGRTLSSLRGDCPPVYMTPDLRIQANPDKANRVFELMRRKFGDARITTVDGIKLTFPHGWALVRQSVTEPALTFRFEGTSKRDLDQIVSMFCESVPGLSDEVTRAKSHHPEENFGA
jgi:phosphomannomutase/phosphoglucomutase